MGGGGQRVNRHGGVLPPPGHRSRSGPRGLASLAHRYFPSMAHVGVDLRVVLFTALLSVLTVILFSILPARAVLGRVLESLLFQVTVRDLLTLFITGAILTAVALMAAWVPARQATGVDPMVALRPD